MHRAPWVPRLCKRPPRLAWPAFLKGLRSPAPALPQRIAAVVALEPPAAAATAGGGLSLQELRAWARERLPAYELPRELRIVDSIPRNAMGKVNKKQLRAALFAAPAPAPAA